MIKFTVFIVLLILALYLLFVDNNTLKFIHSNKIKYNTNIAKRQILKAIYDNKKYIIVNISVNVNMDEIYQFLKVNHIKNVEVNVLENEIIITGECLNENK